MSHVNGSSKASENHTDSLVNGTTGPKKTFADVIAKGKKCVWNKKVEGTQLETFKNHIQRKYGVTLNTYWDVHEWSVENYKEFWAEVWDYFKVIHSKPYDEVATEAECFIDVEWFKGARLNFAENMLRYKDDRIALIYANDNGDEANVTFAELYEEVRLYAAAMRKCGIKCGDSVACYITNRLEAVFVMLAAASIGAKFGGPLPYYGSRAAANILKQMEAKFVFAVDRFCEDKKEYNVLGNIPYIADEVPSLEKIIIVPSTEEAYSSDISHIRDSCFLRDFLDNGRNPDGSVPELRFEQLPFKHPLFVSFTSGTTGEPKGLLHSTGVFLHNIRHFSLCCNIDRNDVVMNPLPCGWNIWNAYMISIALGATVLLYDGFPYFKTKNYVWDVLHKHKVSCTYFLPSILDRMAKEGITPSPGNDLKHLRVVTMGTSPVKLQNFEYMAKVGHENLFVAGSYGATELAGGFSGFNFNLPVYSGELQAPGLGVDLRCLDAEGNDVYGKIGEVVVGKPLPSFPVAVLKDREAVKKIYFSKYKGMWSQNDEAWRDPETKGFVVIGRSDETLNPRGERFGSADIYFAIHDMEELADYLCVAQYNNEGDQRVVLFVKLKKGYTFSQELVKKIQNKILEELTQDFVPEVVLEAKDIPYNLNKKRMERLVKIIIAKNQVPSVSNIRNPECLEQFCNIPELQNY